MSGVVRPVADLVVGGGDAERADARRRVPRQPPQLARQLDGRGLAVGAGDGDRRRGVRGEERRGERGRSGGGVRRSAMWTAPATGASGRATTATAPAAIGGGDEVLAVDRRAGKRPEHRPRRDLAVVDGEAGDLAHGVGRRSASSAGTRSPSFTPCPARWRPARASPRRRCRVSRSGATPRIGAIRATTLATIGAETMARGRIAAGFLRPVRRVEQGDDDVARRVHREGGRERRDVDVLLVVAAELLLGGPGLAADAVARRVRLPAGARRDDHPQQRAHRVATCFRLKMRLPGTAWPGCDLEHRRRVPDAAVDDRGIGGREVERRDRDAVAEADRHRRDLAPVVRRRIQRVAALHQLAADRRQEAERIEIGALPRRAEFGRHVRGADVRRMDEDFGHRRPAAQLVAVGRRGW